MTKKNTVQSNSNITSFWAIAIFVLAILLYANTFNHGFVFDDLTQIEQNALVQKGSKAVPELLTTSYRHGYDGQNSGLYRPLSNVMFALEFEKVGMKARLFHIDNVIIYAIICLLLYLAFAKFLHRFHPGWAVAAAILYTVHPIHTEVVANIKSRDELLNTLGLAISLLCLASYILKPKNIYIVLALIGYTFSLFSKESSITFLAIFPLVLYFFSDFSMKKIIGISSLFLIPAACFLLCLYSILNSLETDHYIDIIQNSLMACHGFGERSATTVAMLGKYVLLMLVPYPLLSDYSYNYIPVMNWFDWQPIATILFFGFAIYYGIKNFKNKNILVFGALFFAISISMVCNVFITISWTLGERFLFIPTIGFCIALVYLIAELLKVPLNKDAESPIKNMKFMGLFGLIVLIYGMQTIDRNYDWKSNMTLFKADVTKAPENARLQALYAKCLNDKAELESNLMDANEAERYYEAAVKIYPYRDFINGLATVQNLKGDFANARNNFLKALSIADSIPDYWHNLGIAYQGLKNLDSSIYAYETAIKYNPDYIKSIINLSGVYGETKQFEKAITTCRRAMQLNPAETRLYSNMCVYFRDMGNKDSAVYYYNKSLGK